MRWISNCRERNISLKRTRNRKKKTKVIIRSLVPSKSNPIFWTASPYTSSLFSFRLRRYSTNFDKRVLRELLLLQPLAMPCRVWLRAPPRPQASISELHTRPGEIPLFSRRFSVHPPFELITDDEGWDDRKPGRLLSLLGLTSVCLSSAEGDFVPVLLLSFSSSLSSNPWSSVAREFRLLWKAFRLLRWDLTINASCVSFPSERLLIRASDCRSNIWAIDAWIYWSNKIEHQE